MFLLQRLQTYVVMAGVALFAIVTVYFRGKADGRQDFEYEIKDKRIEDMMTAKEIEDEVEVLDDEQLSSRASRWVRGNNGR